MITVHYDIRKVLSCNIFQYLNQKKRFCGIVEVVAVFNK